MQLESILTTLVIDAQEERFVATADVAGAYLQTLMTDFIIVKLTGQSVRIMCDVLPSFASNVTTEKGKEVLYMRLNKALYGCMQSALLWYRTFKERLEGLGFKVNNYDPCVANMKINGKVCTIVWYVDDSKISHKEEAVVLSIIKELEKTFGKMSVTLGKKHNFVGMNIKFTEDRKVEINMNDYVSECIDTFGEKLNGGAATPATTKLFETSDEAEDLDEEKKDIFHHIVAKLLFVAKRGRPDIDLAISYLCGRVDRSTTEDWGKLRRLLHYLNGTAEMSRIMCMDDKNELRTWVDASYGTHEDMKGHTGALMSLGGGIVHHKSSKQRINTKNSTESELIGASDYVAYTIWLKRFLKEQGIKLKENIFYQDNESAIKLASNEFGPKSEKSRHIKIRYFFIRDLIKREKIELRHCKTEKMLADFFTKPVQGGLFKTLRDQIMGITTIPIEERVVDCIKDNNSTKKLSIGIVNDNRESNEKRTYAEVIKLKKDRMRMRRKMDENHESGTMHFNEK